MFSSDLSNCQQPIYMEILAFINQWAIYPVGKVALYNCISNSFSRVQGSLCIERLSLTALKPLFNCVGFPQAID